MAAPHQLPVPQAEACAEEIPVRTPSTPSSLGKTASGRVCGVQTNQASVPIAVHRALTEPDICAVYFKRLTNQRRCRVPHQVHMRTRLWSIVDIASLGSSAACRSGGRGTRAAAAAAPERPASAAAPPRGRPPPHPLA